MFHRLKFLAIGAAVISLLAVGAVSGRGVFAQTATPAAGSTSSSTTQYQEFVSKLATNLGIADSATVDTAISTTLTQMVDDALASGSISADEATAAKTAIANGQINDFVDLDSGSEHGNHDGDHDHGSKNKQDDTNGNDSDDTSSTPAAGTSA
jgi:hypothetical protein